MNFELPESYRAYCGDAAVRTAVDHILSADSKTPLALPADIEWKDLPAFHRAVLSAHQVRCEYAVFLIDLWNAVWQAVLDEWEMGGDLRSQSIADAQHWHNAKFDTYNVWDDEYFGTGFEISDTSLLLLVSVLVDQERLRLNLCLWGRDDTDRTTGLKLGDSWPDQDIEDGVAHTSRSLAPIRDDGTIDLDPVRKAAGDALAAVAAHVRS